MWPERELWQRVTPTSSKLVVPGPRLGIEEVLVVRRNGAVQRFGPLDDRFLSRLSTTSTIMPIFDTGAWVFV